MIIRNKVRNIAEKYMDQSHFPLIFSNVGISSQQDSLLDELQKAQAAVLAGADAISDLSLSSNIDVIQKRFIEVLDVPFSSVPIYESFCDYLFDKKSITPEAIVNTAINQIRRGVDVVTLHATVLKADRALLGTSQRLIPSTSRGGTMMLKLMTLNNFENPYYVYFDEILDAARNYHACISLGPMYRPASVWDCQYKNDLHFLELSRMTELITRAKEKGVGIAIEGIGHAPMNLIENLVANAKKICLNVPYRVLTVSTDTAMGFDHVASAISSALAIYYGADSLTCVTRKEHMGLPNVDDIKESVYAAKVAAQSGFSARQKNFQKDYDVSLARSKDGCCAMSDSFLFRDLIAQWDKGNHKGKSCGMCGDFCPFLINETLNG